MSTAERYEEPEDGGNDNLRFISETAVQRALDWLRDNAEVGARFKAERVYAEEYRKTLKAILMKEAGDIPVSAQEREAYSHPEYVKHLESLKQAVFEEERNRALRAAAEIKIAAWQTMNANWRAMRI